MSRCRNGAATNCRSPQSCQAASCPRLVTADQFRNGSTWRRAGVGGGYTFVLMQFAPPAVVEQAECRVTVLLNFGEHDAGAKRVDRSCGDEYDVAFRDRTPLHEVDDRAVPDRCAQFLRRHPM